MAKKLLNERTVRRFQKLAMVSPINEMYNKRDEEEMTELASHGVDSGVYNKRDDEEVMKEEEDEMEMGGEEKAPEMDMGDEEGMDMDGDLELTDEEAKAIIDLGTKLEQAMGGMDDMDMGGEEKAPEMDMGGEEEMGEEDLMEALRGISYVPSQGEIVNEVAQRVARRLKQAKLHEAKLNRALGKRR